MCKILAIAWTTVMLFFTIARTDDVKPWDAETGMLELTEDQFQELVNRKIDRLQVAKVGEHEYSTFKPPFDTGGEPSSSLDKCWKFFDQFVASNKPIYQALSNIHCHNIWGCWCCSNGDLCAAFFVGPTRTCFPSVDPVYTERIRVFEPETEIETESDGDGDD